MRTYKYKGQTYFTYDGDLQQEYAEHCGYKNFEELRDKNEIALKVWYLKMLEDKTEIKLGVKK